MSLPPGFASPDESDRPTPSRSNSRTVHLVWRKQLLEGLEKDFSKKSGFLRMGCAARGYLDTWLCNATDTVDLNEQTLVYHGKPMSEVLDL
jgi:hypothetical protein